MAKRGTKVKLQVGEDLSRKNIQLVIEYLEGDGKPSKKGACAMLGIRYNTTRLAKILDEYAEDVARDKRLRSKKRGTPILKEEACSIITEYLTTRSIARTASTHYRSIDLVKTTLRKYGSDLINAKTDYFNPILLPDQVCRDSFELEEIVWSARHNCMARIRDAVKGGYWVWVLGANAHQAAVATEELGSLQALTSIGVDLNYIASEYSEER